MKPQISQITTLPLRALNSLKPAWSAGRYNIKTFFSVFSVSSVVNIFICVNLWFVLILTLPRVISAEEISAYSFKSNGDRHKEYYWLSGSEDKHGRWTFIGLNKKEVKARIKIEITVLVIRVREDGKETETSDNILVNVGKIKSKRYVGGWGSQEEESWDYSIIRDSRERVKSGAPLVIKVSGFLLPEDGNLAIKITRSGSDRKPWIGIKKDSVAIFY